MLTSISGCFNKYRQISVKPLAAALAKGVFLLQLGALKFTSSPASISFLTSSIALAFAALHKASTLPYFFLITAISFGDTEVVGIISMIVLRALLSFTMAGYPSDPWVPRKLPLPALSFISVTELARFNSKWRSVSSFPFLLIKIVSLSLSPVKCWMISKGQPALIAEWIG